MKRADAIREWSTKRLGLYRKLDDIQTRWRFLANQYVGLPLGFRRDMTLGKWSERFTCAATLEHIAAYPAILNDPSVYSQKQLQEKTDKSLSETEMCPVARGYYAMLHHAASIIRRWEDHSDEDMDPNDVVQLLAEGEAALKAMEVMFRTLTTTYASGQAPEHPSRLMTRAWNAMCESIRSGASLEQAASTFTWEAQGEATQPVPNGGRRVWLSLEVALPPEAASSTSGP